MDIGPYGTEPRRLPLNPIVPPTPATPYHRLMPLAPDATPANRLGLDYAEQARALGAPVVPIIDAHAHINGKHAASIYKDVMDRFGVERVWSQTQLPQADDVRAVLGDRVRFVAIPDYMSPDPAHAHRQGFLDNIRVWHDKGARIVKFWCAPRGRDYGEDIGEPLLLTLDSTWRRKQMDEAASLGMMLMAHIADPDTWFATKYADASTYGTKLSQYEPLERLADEYDVPWLIAHMGGFPEDLDFLTGLLDRHPNLYLDTSATKWMVRELSKHDSAELTAFLARFSRRILFGSDIVTMDAHLTDDAGPRNMGAQASNQRDAFDLYASRYWALRTMFETDYAGESPIADPDLMMVDPARHNAMSAPMLKGHALPTDILRTLYRDAAMELLESRLKTA